MLRHGVHEDLGACSHEGESNGENEVDTGREAPGVLDLGFP
jgi:hypothetical protein